MTTFVTYTSHHTNDFAKVVQGCWPWVGPEDAKRIAGLMEAAPRQWANSRERSWALVKIAYAEAKKLKPADAPRPSGP